MIAKSKGDKTDMIEITLEEMEQAREWLANNLDKWKNWGGFRFLVPEEEIPPLVLKYRAFKKENAKVIEEQYRIMESMGLLD